MSGGFIGCKRVDRGYQSIGSYSDSERDFFLHVVTFVGSKVECVDASFGWIQYAGEDEVLIAGKSCLRIQNEILDGFVKL